MPGAVVWSRRTPWVMGGLALALHLALLAALTPPATMPAGGSTVRAVSVRLLHDEGRGAADAGVPATSSATSSAPPDALATWTRSVTGLPPGVAPTPLALMPYHLPGELDVRPRLVHDVTPDLSWLVLPAGPVQTAVLRLLVNEYGDVDLVSVESTALPAEVMQAVITAYGALKFSPGMIGGRTVRSQLRIEVRLENAAPGPA